MHQQVVVVKGLPCTRSLVARVEKVTNELIGDKTAMPRPKLSINQALGTRMGIDVSSGRNVFKGAGQLLEFFPIEVRV
jgi:hypothetical protein